MKEQLEKRLKELKYEFESGQKMLAEKESELANLRNTLLRISGAIQVLDEEIAKTTRDEGDVSEHPDEINTSGQFVKAAA